MQEVRTRFSPSPTGFQHVGGFRTAFYAWLLAKHYGGKFILRIEDTDQERRVPGAIRFIIEELDWFGIRFDEGPSKQDLVAVGEEWEGMPDIGGPYGPYVQSQRSARYHEAAEHLIQQGFAYRCDCTPEMLERERNEQLARRELPGYTGYCRDRNVSADKPHVVRFRMPPKGEVTLMDAVKGRVHWDSIPLRDMVLLRKGLPTYHLAVVVDDHDMKISHVLRGEEWLSTAPLHVLLYQAFGWQMPTFAHLPVVMGSDGKKLSKRTGASTSKDLRDSGHLAEAVFNYVTLIGWSPGDGEEQEIFSRDELVKRFSLERVNNANGIFDKNKLEWMNGMYMRALSVEEFSRRAIPLIKQSGLAFDAARWEPIAAHVQERVKMLTEVPGMVDFLFTEKITRDLSAMFQKGIDNPKAQEILQAALQLLEPLEDFSVATLEALLRPLAERFSLKVGPLFGVLRVAVTGKKVTPPLFESFVALGKDRVLTRMREALEALVAQA